MTPPTATRKGQKSGGHRRRWPAWWRSGARLGLGLLLVTPLAALNLGRKADSYSIQGWQTEHGLPSNKIRAITQTRDGYLWLATAQGIARFDGRRFTNFTGATNPELRGGGFFAVLEAPDGALWFGGDNGLFRLHNGVFEQFTTAQGLAHNYVRALALTRDGAIVACTREGFSVMRDGRFESLGGTEGRVRGVARSYLERKDGSVLLGTGVGLWRIQGGQIEPLSGGAGFPGSGFNALCETPDGSAWIGYSGGVRRLRPDGGQEDYGPAQGLADPRVQSLQADREGNVWIAGLGGGLFRLARGRIESVTFPGLTGYLLIQRLFEDREESLWLAASTGLFRVRDNMSSTIGQAEGLAHTSVYSVLETRDGAWWIGLWGGGVYRYDQSRAVPLAVPPALELDYVLALAEDPDGTLWIGANSGLYRHRDGVTTNLYLGAEAIAWRQRLTQEPGLILPGFAHGHVNSIAPDGAGGLWVGTDGALYHGREGAWRAFTTADGLPGEFFRSVIRTRGGDLWVTAAPGGVAQLHAGRWTYHLCGQAIAAVAPRAVFEDSQGVIWVTTEGGGLNRFQDGHWRTFTIRDGLADDFISGIVEDQHGNFWIAFPRGVMHVPRTEFADLDAGRRAALRVRVFDKADGLPAAESNQTGSPNTCLARDGRVLLATDGGVAVIEPENLKHNELPPRMHLEQLVINGTPADLSRPVTVPPGGGYVQIRFTAISLPAPEKVRFKVRLAPLDSDWIDNGGRTEVRYDKLPPGRYMFQAIAANNDGVWNNAGVTQEFTVRPYFYQTGWFIGSVVLAGVGGMLGLYAVRVRQARRQVAVLEALVSERTRQLQSSEAFLNSLVENLPVHIYRQDRAGRFVFANRLFCERFGRAPGQIAGATIFDFLPAPEAERQQRVDGQVMADGEIVEMTDEPITIKGEAAFIHLVKVPVFDAARRCVGLQAMFLDVTARKRAEAELARLHQQLLDSSRRAGMAEVATDVLHNVGNVLNSVNVSATLVADQVRRNTAGKIAPLAALFEQHKADLAGFVTADERGRKIPAYLGALAEALAAEQEAQLKELDHLRKNIGHIKDIVSLQQARAGTIGVIETVAVRDLVEEALRLDGGTPTRHPVMVNRDYQAHGAVATDRHKVIQILVNLLSNARQACEDSGRPDGQIDVRTTRDGGGVQIAISDNGVGIPPENLTRIFRHGFTTRTNGHGFGLHSGALAARELGGSLSVRSDGPGHGATFTLVLPGQPVATAAAKSTG